MRDHEISYKAIDYEDLTVSSEAVQPDSSKRKPNTSENSFPKMLEVTVETDQVRYRVDGGDPTAASGHLLEVGDIRYFYGPNIQKVKFIRVDTDATLRITYYR